MLARASVLSHAAAKQLEAPGLPNHRKDAPRLFDPLEPVLAAVFELDARAGDQILDQCASS